MFANHGNVESSLTALEMKNPIVVSEESIQEMESFMKKSSNETINVTVVLIRTNFGKQHL